MGSIRQNASGLEPHMGCEKKADKPDQFEIFALHCREKLMDYKQRKILYEFNQTESYSLENKEAVIKTLDLKLIEGEMETYELLEDGKVYVVRLEEAPCPACGAGGVYPCDSEKCDPEGYCRDCW